MTDAGEPTSKDWDDDDQNADADAVDEAQAASVDGDDDVTTLLFTATNPPGTVSATAVMDGRTVRVAVEGAAEGWLAGVPSTELIERARDGALLVGLTDGATPDVLLDAARGAGTVTHFSLERPTLTDLFRRVVAS